MYPSVCHKQNLKKKLWCIDRLRFTQESNKRKPDLSWLRIQQTPYNWLFLLTYVILDYHFKQVILCILNLHVLVQWFISRYICSSIKETNWLINKRMCVLLFDVFKHLLLRKIDLLKTCRKSKFLRKKIWRNALALKRKKVQGIFGKPFILALLSSAIFCLQNRVSYFF